MPLSESRAERIRKRLNTRLPPSRLDYDTAMGGTGTIRGYVNESKGSLDALGIPDRTAVFYAQPDQTALAPGDELDARWVIWRDPHAEADWDAYDLRRLPDFVDWTRTTRTMTGRDPATRAPIYTETDTTISAYLLRLNLGAGETEAEIEPGRSATLLIKGDATTVAIGDRVSQPSFGTHRVTGVQPYGPWARATIEEI